MDLICEERPSASPLVERIWRSHSDPGSVSFISMAEIHCGIVMRRDRTGTTLTVRGPETRATTAASMGDVELLGITFKPGVFMPALPAKITMDRHDVDLPEAGSQSFWLNGAAWQYPDFENVDTFINRLVRAELLVFDPVVDAVVKGQPVEMSVRTLQRRFLQATGLTHTVARQIERARYATGLLKQGVSILDTVFEASYFDQPHLTRSLKYFVGLTPSQIIDEGRSERLSFLYKTKPLC